MAETLPTSLLAVGALARPVQIDTRTEVVWKSGIARIFGEVFDEDHIAYFSFSGFMDLVQAGHSSWSTAVNSLVTKVCVCGRVY